MEHEKDEKEEFLWENHASNKLQIETIREWNRYQ